MAGIDHLFVYGTLRRGIRHVMHNVIADHADLVGEGVAPGILYDLGPYPGLWLDPAGGPGVRGEVYRIRPGRGPGLLEQLDDYEGLRAGEVEDCAYRREQLPIRHGPLVLPAWTYVLNRLPPRAVVVAGGDYLAWMASR